nr:hypothetical protein [Actinomycetota bacterium]
EEAATTSRATARPRGGPPATSGRAGVLPVARFNARLERAGGAWARSPLAVAARFLGRDRLDVYMTSVATLERRDGRDRVVVTTTIARARDDSISAIRYVLALESRPGGRWRLRSARFTQRCAPGRGHQAFSADPCL